MPLRLPFAPSLRSGQALRLSPFALVLACQTAAEPAAPAGLSAADRATIDSLHIAFAAAAVAADFTTVASMYTDDASVLPPNAPIATGRIAIKNVLSQFPPLGEMKLITTEAHGTTDLAAVRGTYTLLFAPPGQLAYSDTGKFVELWRKQADGNWLIVWDIFNSSVAIPPTTSAH